MIGQVALWRLIGLAAPWRMIGRAHPGGWPARRARGDDPHLPDSTV